MKTILMICTIAIIMACGFFASAQVTALEAYKDVYFEIGYDDDGGNVINTHCGMPTNSLRFVLPVGEERAHFTIDNEPFHIVSVKKGQSDEEFIIRYIGEFEDEEVALFYYDRAVKTLFFDHDGIEYAFASQSDLSHFNVVDECDK